MAFFCSKSLQQLWNLSKDILFGHFVTTLNDAFECELAQEDEGYESGSESVNIPTPLHRAPRLYHVSTLDNLSFDPATPLTSAEPHPASRNHHPVCHHLMFSSSDEEGPVQTRDPHLQHPRPLCSNLLPTRTSLSPSLQHQISPHSFEGSFQDAMTEEEDFSIISLDDDIWLEDPVPDRNLCIHGPITTKLPVSLSLPIWLGSSVFHP